MDATALPKSGSWASHLGVLGTPKRSLSSRNPDPLLRQLPSKPDKWITRDLRSIASTQFLIANAGKDVALDLPRLFEEQHSGARHALAFVEHKLSARIVDHAAVNEALHRRMTLSKRLACRPSCVDPKNMHR
jgi:hypothetical protein